MTLRTEYDFVLPRGYVDESGSLHQSGTMRLATARDELAPLRDPLVQGPDDPRITVLVLTRVVTRLGTLSQITPHEIEGLFAADLAFLQDFYGVINFGTQAEYEALLRAQAETPAPPTPIDPKSVTAAPAPGAPAAAVAEPAGAEAPAEKASVVSSVESGTRSPLGERSRRAAIEEIPAGGR